MDSFGNEYNYGSCGYAGWGVEEWSEIHVYYNTITEAMTNDDYLTNYSLYQNYPNPFNPSTTIRYTIPNSVNSEWAIVKSKTKNGVGTARELSLRTINVELKIYDILGREVATLVNEKQKPGNYEVVFPAKDGPAFCGDGYYLPSGVYIYRLMAGDFTESKKMLLLK